jgi:hypothetical protein
MEQKHSYLALGAIVGLSITIFFFNDRRDMPIRKTSVAKEDPVSSQLTRNDPSDIRSRKRLDDIKNKKLAKLARERTEAQREAGILARKNAPNYLLIGDDGKLTQQALRESGISPLEANRIQMIFDKKWKEVSLALSMAAQLDKEASDFDNGIYAYNIPALPDGGAENVSQIEKGIKELVGPSISSQLIDAFSPNQYLCGFGKYDVKIVIYPTSQDGKNNIPTAEYSFTHPASSQVVRRGRVTQEKFHQLFGFVIDNLTSNN